MFQIQKIVVDKYFVLFKCVLHEKSWFVLISHSQCSQRNDKDIFIIDTNYSLKVKCPFIGFYMFKRKSLVSAGFPILFLYNRGSPDYTNITLYNANTELLDTSIYLSRFIPPILLLATLLYWYNQLIYIHNTRSGLRRQFRNYKTSFFVK